MSHLLKSVDLRLKKPISPQNYFPHPPIFQTKHIRMILTVQILRINAISSSKKKSLHDLRTHKAHYGTHFARGQRKISVKFAFNLVKT